MTTKELATTIRGELKAAGYSSKEVSVKAGAARYDTRIDITIKNAAIPMTTIEGVAKKYEKIDRCQYSGEILAGCNTYIFISHDYDVMQAEYAKRQHMADAIYSIIVPAIKPSGGKAIHDDHGHTLWFMKGDPDRGYLDSVVIFDGEKFNNRERMILHTPHYLARAIAKFELYGTLN